MWESPPETSTPSKDGTGENSNHTTTKKPHLSSPAQTLECCNISCEQLQSIYLQQFLRPISGSNTELMQQLNWQRENKEKIT